MFRCSLGLQLKINLRAKLRNCADPETRVKGSLSALSLVGLSLAYLNAGINQVTDDVLVRSRRTKPQASGIDTRSQSCTPDFTCLLTLGNSGLMLHDVLHGRPTLTSSTPLRRDSVLMPM